MSSNDGFVVLVDGDTAYAVSKGTIVVESKKPSFAEARSLGESIAHDVDTEGADVTEIGRRYGKNKGGGPSDN